jgi:hypothetical protein
MEEKRTGEEVARRRERTLEQQPSMAEAAWHPVFKNENSKLNGKEGNGRDNSPKKEQRKTRRIKALAAREGPELRGRHRHWHWPAVSCTL